MTKPFMNQWFAFYLTEINSTSFFQMITKLKERAHHPSHSSTHSYSSYPHCGSNHREGKGLNPRPNGWISAPLDGSDKGAAARRRIHGRARACLEGWSEGDRRRCGRGIFSPCNWRGVAEEVAQIGRAHV